ncbi:MAG: TRAP transporter large permease [Spirochaetales bacterium]|jgi:tripartite ATP-independent transporter DctM subunit|nr:TRAP transporter large permease [Spirochaetales bacterium]
MNEITLGTALLFGLLVLFMLVRIPIAFSLGISSLFTAMYLNIPFFNLFQKMATGLTSFTFMCVPFFIIMAQIMTEGGISDKLTQFCNVLVGRMRGGTAMVNIIVSMFFGGISGSSIADVSSIGAFLIPAMEKEGYDKGYSVAVTVTSSVQGIIIPPSQNMIFYCVASASGISISTMFIAGYLPGILLGLSLMIPAYIIAVKRRYPISTKKSFRENAIIIRESLLGLFTILIIIFGITFGIFTATESAAVAAMYALLLTVFVYRTLTFKKFIHVLFASLKPLATVMAIIATSSAFSYILSYLRVPARVAGSFLALTSNPLLIMLMINILLLILGCFMDMGILILLLTPILFPVATGIGYDPYHFGIVMILNLGIGLCTPPVGTSLFAGCAIANLPIEKAIKDFFPFYGGMIVLLAIIIIFPQICLWLPELLAN